MARIAIVDDHSFFRRGLAAALSSEGHDVVISVGTGAEALKEIKQHQPDLVLLDLRMRGMDGVSVLQAMRANNDHRPVIALTADLSDEALIALMRSKVNGIVFKHCAESRLFEAINAVAAGMKFIDAGLIDKAFALSAEAKPNSNLKPLSKREALVAEKAALGLRNREIAEALGMSEGTVKLYLHNVYVKLAIGNRTELAVLLKSPAMSEQAD